MSKSKSIKKVVVPVITAALLLSTVVTSSANTLYSNGGSNRVVLNYNIRTNTTSTYKFNIVKHIQSVRIFNFNKNTDATTPKQNDTIPNNNEPQEVQNPSTNSENPTPSVPSQPQEPSKNENQPATPSKPVQEPQVEKEPQEQNPNTEPQNTSNAKHALTAAEIEMVNYVNQARKDAGLQPLAIDVDLSYVARVKSKDMQDNNYFSHTSPTYGSPFDMMKNFGIQYKSAAENIAINSSVSGAHNAFMNSEGHRNNILNPRMTHIGIGIENRHYTQMFIQK
ncbi:uncharacterized protein, YkwD family [Anaerovirgula multivorans]|uniref:Uncharacterized protein, YkwD family n=1 Tax=Anaerovirgula multivorans TaxID=312168 RepID=A0A239DMR8_9FIRM|nr:CAP domain-containing protein [Anaerovirgula multivorans]SNS33092.1 uncharacterized protein, YkwD family [Anaerovirgula multivorans]